MRRSPARMSVIERESPPALLEQVSFRGHPMVRALHRTTIEVTVDEHLTPDGDCIVGVGAEKGCADLRDEVKSALRREGAVVKVTFQVGKESFSLTARGDPGLELTHPHDMVIRKSTFLSDRTLAVGASASAKDMPRSMVAALKEPGSVGVMILEVA